MDDNAAGGTVRTHLFRARPILEQTRQVDLLARAKQHALDPEIFDEHPPFFWRGEFSNSLLDAYFTFMNDRTLQNYAADAQAGIAFLRGHRHWELPLGQSLTGVFESTEDRKRTVADFYTITGLPETDDLIRRMKSGIARDLSVGFHGGREICTLCGHNYYSWDCNHIRGLIYEIEENGVVRRQLATVEIDDAHASEASAVYDGATPNAEVIKAERMVSAGEINPDDIRILEERYRVRLPQPKRTFAGAEIPNRSTDNVNPEEQLTQIRSVLGLGEDGNILPSLEALATDAETLRAQVATLEPLANDGRAYRSDLIAEAMAEGVRAYGDSFDADTYKGILDAAPLATVKRMRDDWKGIGDKRFAGGRKTADNAQTAKPQAEQPQRKRAHVPAGAYKA